MLKSTSRRTVLQGAAASLALQFPRVWAQTYPERPLRFIVPYPPGGASDVIGRLVAQGLAARLGQPVVVENKAGADGAIGMQQAAQLPPDGHSLVLGNLSTQVILPAMGVSLPYDAERSFTMVALLVRSPMILVVRAGLPRDLPQLLQAMKASAQPMTCASSGVPSSRLAAFMFRNAGGVQLTLVPYKGDAPALQDLMSGQIDMGFAGPIAVLPLVKAGPLKAVALAARRRLVQLPGVPTFSESGLPGVEAETWQSMLVPARTPSAILNLLNAEVSGVLAEPDVRARLHSMGATPGSGSLAEIGTFVETERLKWTPLVKQAGSDLRQ